MKRFLQTIIVFLLLISPGLAEEEASLSTPASPKVFVIPVKTEINDAVLYLVRRGVAEAEDVGAQAIILDMDTPGGAVQTTEEILKNLAHIKIPTYTFVEYNAISAGAIIACATDKIYMRPGSKIGDAMPVVMGQSLEEAEREKAEAYVDALIRTVAEKTGRDPALLSCMVRRDQEYKIGKEVICEKGQLLTLTNGEAEKTYGKKDKPLLSEGTVETMQDMLALEGMENAQIVTMELTWAEDVFQYIAHISPLLLGLGFLGIMAAVYNPSLTLPGLLWAGLCFFTFFFGHHIAGLAGYEEGIVFVIGLLLILLEIFIIPGFGVAGILGLMLVVGSLLAAMVQVYPGTFDPKNPFALGLEISDLKGPVLALSLSTIIAGVCTGLMARFVPRTRAFENNFVLSETIHQEDQTKETLIGKEGVSLTALRPSGKVQVGEEILDVFTQGDFVDANSTVAIIQAKGSRIIVQEISPKEQR